jgi:hypothetical protein
MERSEEEERDWRDELRMDDRLLPEALFRDSRGCHESDCHSIAHLLL